ncbi:hypothetical protein LCGC14_3028140, partial [marine sediment metagenome]
MIDVEFLPERIRRQRARLRMLIRQAYLLAACVLAMGGLTYLSALRVGRARGELS